MNIGLLAMNLLLLSSTYIILHECEKKNKYQLKPMLVSCLVGETTERDWVSFKDSAKTVFMNKFKS